MNNEVARNEMDGQLTKVLLELCNWKNSKHHIGFILWHS